VPGIPGFGVLILLFVLNPRCVVQICGEQQRSGERADVAVRKQMLLLIMTLADVKVSNVCSALRWKHMPTWSAFWVHI